LIARFGENTDHRQAFFILRNRRQKSDETIQPFSDELFTLSRKAYPNLPGHEAFIETELIEIFIDGLRSPELQLKLLRESPRTLMDAAKPSNQLLLNFLPTIPWIFLKNSLKKFRTFAPC
jgi:hypothetical protein